LDGSVEAVIVAGGLGTRLLPLTESSPKHLLPVAGVPFAVHQIAKLATAGIRRVLLATSYQADRFEPILGDGSRWDLELVYVTEAEPLGTGGAIRNVSGELTSRAGDPVVILNGDILSGHDLSAQLSAHQDRGADVTLHLVKVADPRAYGCVPTDAQGNVTAFLEKSPRPVSAYINAGCYVFTREVIDRIPPGEVVSVERETFPQLVADGARVVGHHESAYWLDVGTPEALRRASADLVLGVATSVAYREQPAEFWAAPDAEVSPTASLTGGTCVGAGATVADEAGLSGTLVFDRAMIGRGAVVTDSVVGSGARIGAGAVLRECVLGDEVVVAPGARWERERMANRTGM
jgi:mannose-1-phosphate guanylyltransferase